MVQEIIEKTVKEHSVVLYMKGTPSQPMCGFSAMVVQVLDKLGVDFFAVNVLENTAIRQGIKKYSNWPTIPQLYICGDFIGGCDIVKEMYSCNELQELLKSKNISISE